MRDQSCLCCFFLASLVDSAKVKQCRQDMVTYILVFSLMKWKKDCNAIRVDLNLRNFSPFKQRNGTYGVKGIGALSKDLDQGVNGTCVLQHVQRIRVHRDVFDAL